MTENETRDWECPTYLTFLLYHYVHTYTTACKYRPASLISLTPKSLTDYS